MFSLYQHQNILFNKSNIIPTQANIFILQNILYANADRIYKYVESTDKYCNEIFRPAIVMHQITEDCKLFHGQACIYASNVRIIPNSSQHTNTSPESLNTLASISDNISANNEQLSETYISDECSIVEPYDTYILSQVHRMPRSNLNPISSTFKTPYLVILS